MPRPGYSNPAYGGRFNPNAPKADMRFFYDISYKYFGFEWNDPFDLVRNIQNDLESDGYRIVDTSRNYAEGFIDLNIDKPGSDIRCPKIRLSYPNPIVGRYKITCEVIDG